MSVILKVSNKVLFYSCNVNIILVFILKHQLKHIHDCAKNIIANKFSLCLFLFSQHTQFYAAV